MVPPVFLILCEESGMPQTYSLCFFAWPMNVEQLADTGLLQIDTCLKLPHLHPNLVKHQRGRRQLHKSQQRLKPMGLRRGWCCST